ncbi:MAG: hypothetical protein U0V70_10030 [Terriglobia bacterium]
MNRRQALSLLALSAWTAPRAWTQTRPSAKCRVFMGFHGLLLEPEGTLKSWLIQERSDGLAPDWLGLGHNQPLAAFTLMAIPGLSNVVTAAAGNGCSFAVLSDGQLLSWGWNSGSGLLGTTPLSALEVTASWGPNSNAPIPLATKFDAVDVSTQEDHVLALARDGGVYAWGKGNKGQLGIGPLPIIKFKTHTPSAMTYVPFPVRVPDLTDAVAISAGRRHSLALLKDGTVRAWGENRWGELGDGTTTNRDRPVPVQGIRNAVAIATGGDAFSVALLADGTVMTWGHVVNGALGRPPWNNDDTPSPIPALVPGVQGIRAIGAGLRHVIALTEAGTVVSWGDGTFGSLGRGDNKTSLPASIKSLSGVQSIFTINSTCFAVLATGRIMTWGAVRPWTRPGGGMDIVSRSPILLWIDGLDQT